ncbi:hypothetical protein BDZ89DRAFT_1060841 [Hymenopellis radicata]|nr:hypothetical protein BDZ89DRAFT_1060841 [Hymenopellis radicata]
MLLDSDGAGAEGPCRTGDGSESSPGWTSDEPDWEEDAALKSPGHRPNSQHSTPTLSAASYGSAYGPQCRGMNGDGHNATPPGKHAPCQVHQQVEGQSSQILTPRTEPAAKHGGYTGKLRIQQSSVFM